MTNIDGSSGRAPSAAPGFSKDPQQALTALDGLFATHEIRVLGLVGILTGYVCVLFVKMMGLSSPFVGIGGVVLITLMLLFLDPQMDELSPNFGDGLAGQAAVVMG
jgi:hypothetical protein